MSKKSSMSGPISKYVLFLQKIAMSEENQEMVKHKVSRSLGVIDFKIKIFFGVNLLGL